MHVHFTDSLPHTLSGPRCSHPFYSGLICTRQLCKHSNLSPSPFLHLLLLPSPFPSFSSPLSIALGATGFIKSFTPILPLLGGRSHACLITNHRFSYSHSLMLEAVCTYCPPSFEFPSTIIKCPFSSFVFKLKLGLFLSWLKDCGNIFYRSIIQQFCWRSNHSELKHLQNLCKAPLTMSLIRGPIETVTVNSCSLDLWSLGT